MLETIKKILPYAGATIIIIVVLIVVIIMVKKKPSKDIITINMAITIPNGSTRRASVGMKPTTVQGLDVGDFIESTLGTSNLLPWKEIYVYWESININDYSVDILDGAITEDGYSKKLYDIFNPIPNIININANIKHTCSADDKIRVQATCDPCKSQGPICTEDQGWVCQDNQICPDVSDLVKCCENSPNGPYGYCDPKTKIVTCGPCPGTPNCGDPGCKGIGPICTGTGWICEEGVLCPTGVSLSSCCTKKGEHAVCNNGIIYCTACTGPTPTCNPDCNNTGLICKPDGTWDCSPGIVCPPIDIQRKCCSGKTPVPVCKNGDSKVTCTDCSKLSKPICPPSCDGNGLLCTATGWICAKNIVCPTPQQAKDLKCCPPDYIPICENNCIKCNCPTGKYACGPSSTCGTSSQVCCDNGVPCSQDPISKKWECCSAKQTCPSGCCPAETICKNGECVAICGIDSQTGEPYTCGPNSSCVVIENATSDQWAKIQKQNPNARKDPKTGNIYMCVNSNGSCVFTSDEEISIPAAISNYYGCYAFPSTDSDNPNGYCAGKIDSNTLACSKYSTVSDCNQDGNCTWRDVLSFMAQGKDQNDLQDRAQQIQTDMGYIQNNWNGNFCYPENEAYQRVVVFNGNSNCSYEDCINQIAQPGIIDITYNEDTGTCVGLQACNNYAGQGMTNLILNNSGKYIPNPNIKTPISSSSQSDSQFPDCTTNPKCNLGLQSNKFVCNDTTGRIENPTVWFGNNNNTPLATCTEIINPPPNAQGPNYFDSRQHCYEGICSSTDDKCCLPGWKWDFNTSKCYIKQPTACEHDCPSHCSCKTNSCGTSYRAHAYGTCPPFHECHYGCYAGGSITDSDSSNPQKMTTSGKSSLDRQYCVCDDSGKWQDWNKGPFRLDSGDSYKCKIGSKDDSCTVTYSCPKGYKIYNGKCCKSNCTNKNCGDDGCGGSCGTCEEGNCVNGNCSCYTWKSFDYTKGKVPEDAVGIVDSKMPVAGRATSISPWFLGTTRADPTKGSWGVFTGVDVNNKPLIFKTTDMQYLTSSCSDIKYTTDVNDSLKFNSTPVCYTATGVDSGSFDLYYENKCVEGQLIKNYD